MEDPMIQLQHIKLKATPPRANQRREPIEPSKSLNLQQLKEAKRIKEALGEVTGRPKWCQRQPC